MRNCTLRRLFAMRKRGGLTRSIVAGAIDSADAETAWQRIVLMPITLTGPLHRFTWPASHLSLRPRSGAAPCRDTRYVVASTIPLPLKQIAMQQRDIGSLAPTRRPRSARRAIPILLAVGLCVLLVGLLNASWASAGAPARDSNSKALDLTGTVTKVRKHIAEEEETEEFHSTVELQSGSKSAGTLSTDDCTAIAIHFLICSGKASIEEFGSGLDFKVEWPCVDGDESNCSSVGDGIVSRGDKTIATIKVKASYFNFMKLHERFSVEIQRGAPRIP